MPIEDFGLRPEHLEELHRRVPAPPKPWTVEVQMSYHAGLDYGAMKTKDENPDWYPVDEVDT